MADYKGLNYLKSKLSSKYTRCVLRYNYYEEKIQGLDIGGLNNDARFWYKPVSGWSAKAVDSLADRLSFREFKNDTLGMTSLFNVNNPDILYDNAIRSALITSCSFIYILKDGTDVRFQVIDGRNATGILDPITNLLTEGYAVLERDDYEQPIKEAYFTRESTIAWDKNGTQEYYNPTDYALLVPIIYRPDAKRPFGHSRISRACMNLQQAAMKTLKQSMISGEFYSYPQRYVLGLDPNKELLDSWKATMTTMLTFDKDRDGGHPTVGQFNANSMTPYTEQLKMYASLFAGETGLTLDDLGFSTENPSSVEAIKAQHENLRLTARKAQKTFGTGLLNTGYLAACLRDDYSYRRDIIAETIPCWEPLFEPDSSALSIIGDGAIKINQAVPGYFNVENLRDLTGIEASDAVTSGTSSIISTLFGDETE